MDQSAALIRRMHEVAPPGQRELDDATRRQLTELTAALMAARPQSADEYRLYMDTMQRGLDVPHHRARAHIAGQTIVVTGGSGCLGTVLCQQLAALGAARIISIAVTPPERKIPGVAYVHLDIRERDAVARFMAEIRPDIVFHLAAQRAPGLAEREVSYTISTNIIGTRNVLEAAEAAGVSQLVHASTGKALRPYTKDVYAASKRASEWVVARAGVRGILPCSMVRFTHVVDNSIFLQRLEEWCRDDQVIRLHSPDAAFYAQSALESAQLLLHAAMGPRDQATRIYTIRDLGWPVSVLGLALGMLMDIGKTVPVYLAGYEPGYEAKPYPGLFDPAIAGSVSPLMNAFEANQLDPASNDVVDSFATPGLSEPRAVQIIDELEHLCRQPTHSEVLRAALDHLSWTLLDTCLRGTPRSILRRVTSFTESYRHEMNGEYLLLDDIVRHWAGLNRHPFDTTHTDEHPIIEVAPSARLG